MVGGCGISLGLDALKQGSLKHLRGNVARRGGTQKRGFAWGWTQYEDWGGRGEKLETGRKERQDQALGMPPPAYCLRFCAPSTLLQARCRGSRRRF